MTDLLKISLLGGLQIEKDGQPVAQLASRTTEALLAYLVCTKRPYSRETLATLFWDDRSQTQALGNLRVVLSSLRKHLKPYFVITRKTVAFNTESNFWLDTDELMGRVSRTEQEDTAHTSALLTQSASLQQAVSLYQGDFLAGFYLRESRGFEEWALLERERLRRIIIEALEALVEHCLTIGAYQDGVRYAARLLELDSLQEKAHRQMMRLLIRRGQRSAALQQYQICRHLLLDELGVEPMAETTRLYLQIKAVSSVGAHNLPPQPTAFVGRESELAQLGRLLRNPNHRLVTLTGPGGIGKTRLAIETARQCQTAFLHGVCFVPLASLPTADLLPAAIAESLQLSLGGVKNLKKTLLNTLKDRELLLLLDNFEHLIEGGTELLAKILQTVERVTVLVTSSERLNLRAETVFRVDGLQVPTKMGTKATETYSAVQLFLQNARHAQPNFAPDAGGLTHIVRICQLVEGIPLGIELASAWVRVLPCREIAAEIESSLEFLTASSRDTPERHRSLKAIFERAWKRLSTKEKRVFEQLSAFYGGADYRAAQEVAGASLWSLSSLVDKSLLTKTPDDRYKMLNMVRQFAAEKLAESPEDYVVVRTRHCLYYAALLKQQEAHLQGEKRHQTLNEIGVEIENVRTAWQWAVEQGAASPLTQMLGSLFRFFDTRGWLGEGEEAFKQVAKNLAARASLDAEQDLLLGKIQSRLGKFSLDLGHHARAGQLFQASLVTFEQFNERTETAMALGYLGVIAHLQGEYGQAAKITHQSLRLATEIEDADRMAFCFNLLGNIAQTQGDYEEAQWAFEESLRVRETIDDQFGIAIALNNLGNLAQAQKQYAAAKDLYQKSHAIFQKSDYRLGMGATLTNAGHAAWKLGDYAAAEDLHQQSLKIKQALGNQRGISLSLTNLGEVACSRGDYQAAKSFFHQALALATEICTPPLTVEILSGIAALWAQSAKQEAAVSLLTLIQGHSASKQETLDRIAQLLADLATQLPPEAVSAAKMRAKSWELESAAKKILQEA